jgi:hypothetical protein
MQYTDDEKNMLSKVNDIGMQIDTLPEENLIFITLSPYLDALMAMLKRLKPAEMDMLFMQYEGVMKVMGMIENEAQKMEKELGLK